MKATITFGMGFGDEAKGSTIDYLTTDKKSQTRLYGYRPQTLVVRYSGGSQCGHNVERTDGVRHTFSQFGAGTFNDIGTYLDSKVIVNLEALQKEATHLEECGVTDPYTLLTINPDCLVTTYYHRLMNVLRESCRTEKHGTCGHGIGETRQYWLRYGNDAIFMKDAPNVHILTEKLELLKQRLLDELQPIITDTVDNGLLRYFATTSPKVVAQNISRRVPRMRSRSELRNHLPDDCYIVFEGAQGALLDEWMGFHPHTTWSTVTPHNAIELCEEWKIDDYELLGITRAYSTRHGNGPFPTISSRLTDTLIDKGNPTNKHQGNFRVGHFDFPLFNYVRNADLEWWGRGIDGLVVNHLDQIPDNVEIVVDYKDENKISFQPVFSNTPNLTIQKQLCAKLWKVKPIYKFVSKKTFISMLHDAIPIKIEGYGPKATDKHILT